MSAAAQFRALAIGWVLASCTPVPPRGLSTPGEIKQPELRTFELPPYFYVDPEGAGVVFNAPVGGTR